MTAIPQRLQIAVIGSASDGLSEVQKALALAVGRQIIDAGCRLISGGMGGVMRYASQGARESAHYCPGDIIGVLPSYQKTEANPFIDIALPTGLGVARNAVLMSACDAVIALDGGSGTLSEIALAWQMQKPIACMGEEGWHQRLNSLALDQRRDDAIAVPGSLQALEDFLAQLHVRDQAPFQGIQRSGGGPAQPHQRHSPQDITLLQSYLEHSFSTLIQGQPFDVLGQGSEGTVFACGTHIFKVFYRTDFTQLLFSHLSQMAAQLNASHSRHDSPLPRFGVHKGEWLVVHYPRFDSSPYLGDEPAQMVSFLRAMHQAGVCLSNVKADNFRVTPGQQLVFIDIGRDLMPFSDAMFMSMCKRAFLTVYFSQHPRFKAMCSHTNDHDGFMPVDDDKGARLTAEQVGQLFKDFYKEVIHGEL
ncbi:TIGR00725 family protein [Pokkaliibacter sp. MBI-7]|uniref:TIGR00725 family protein n=1 Tax=Pokkaliibacter sp. MBI-7 TaxID=3040600 RepID=UPI00244744FF|nr:TIGR00725 family protein [Pokkaliibacter sp. MBI-7]MDH2433075.1 TIGR00725 family protein [Pokkaliibacter sp. MBI-7]